MCLRDNNIINLDQNGQLDLKKKGQLDRYTPWEDRD